MKKQTFAKGAVILAVCSIAAKGLGGVYRIALTSVLGGEGIGYYQLVFPFFSLVLALLANGLPVAVSKLVSAELAADNKGGVRTLVKRALSYAALAGLLGGVFTIAISRLLAGAQSTTGVYICYIAIAPAIVFVTLAGVFKGWFLGSGNMTTVGISQVVEVVAKLSLGLVIAVYFSRYGVIQAVAGALLAVSISEFAGFLFIFFRYLSERKYYKGIAYEDKDFGFLHTLLPISLSGLVFPLVAFVDSLTIVNLLEYGGDVAGVKHYGLLTGPVNSLINMPIVFSMSVAVAIVPALASAMANYDVVSVKHKTAMSVKVCFLLAFPFFVGGGFLSRQLVNILYPALAIDDKRLTAVLLSIVAVNILLLSLLEVFNAVLTGLGRTKPVLVNVALGGGIKIGLQLLLVPRFGIAACAVATIVFYLVSMLLNATLYNDLVGKNTNLIKSISKIFVSGAIMSVAVLLAAFVKNDILSVLLGVVLGGAAYIFSLLLTHAVEPEELRMLPFGKRLAGFLQRTKLLKENGKDL